MNKISVQSTDNDPIINTLERLTGQLPSLPPELKKAATYLLEHADDIGVCSMREIAASADVKPNTLVRLARTIGFEGYEELRQPFREQARGGSTRFPDQARWLQSLASGGRLPALYADMASASLADVEGLFRNHDVCAIQSAANAILAAKRTYVLGVGIANAVARNFAYLTNMAIGNIESIPRDGSLPVDGLAHAGSGDLLIAMTFRPYRSEVVEAVEAAHKLGVNIISISDSPACPTFQHTQSRFVVPMQGSQFFTSTVALSALFETLMAFVIAEGGAQVVDKIEHFHARRHALGIYVEDGA